MVDFSIIIAYALTFLIPLIVIGVGSLANENRASSMLAFLLLISFLTYYTKKEILPFWVYGTVLIFVSFIMVFLYKGVVGGGSD